MAAVRPFRLLLQRVFFPFFGTAEKDGDRTISLRFVL